jgi:fructooligosaccharide transport system substrate-binding protein
MLPTRKSVYLAFPEFSKLPLYILKDQLLKSGHPRPSTPAYLNLTVEFQKAYADIMQGADPKVTLDAAAKRVDTYIQRQFKK